MLYTENPKDATRKLLEFISEFGQVAGDKINTTEISCIPTTLTTKDQEEKLREKSHLPLHQKE